jgi:hypothetical protein
LGSEVALTPQERRRGQPEGGGGSIDDVTGALAQHTVTADAIIRAQAERRGKIGLRLPPRHIEADLADDGLRHGDIDAVDPDEVDAADAVQFTAHVKLRGMAAAFRRRVGRERGGSPGVVVVGADSAPATLSAKAFSCCSSA